LLQFVDQFVLRPTGSTTAATIALLNTVISLLSSEVEPYVIVISFDFFKAFDTVRRSSVLHKPAQLDIPDYIYNWLADFFYNHSHCTLFQQSSLLDITASIIQGSAIGQAAYVVAAGDLTAAVSGNSLCKFADDTNLIIPAFNDRHTELVNVQNWAKRNNLKSNCDKSFEVVFTDSRRR